MRNGSPEYEAAFRAAWEEMLARLRRDGLPEPLRTTAMGGSAGLTADDARQEVAELERVLRKHGG